MAEAAALLSKAIELLRRGDPTAAEKALAELLAQHPEHPDALYLAGTVAAQSGRLDEAAKHLEGVLKQHPDHFGATVNLGNVYRSGGRPRQAVERYRQAVALQPEADVAHACLGAALEELADYPAAEASLNEALRLNPNNVAAWINLATVYRKSARAVEGEKACRRALALNPQALEAHFNLGSLLSEQSRFEEAAGHFMRVVERAPRHVTALVYLAECLFYLSRYDEAAGFYGRAVQLDPERFDAHINYGLSLAWGSGVPAIREVRSRMSQDHIYTSMEAPLALARQLLGGLSYPNPEARAAAAGLLDVFQPDQLYPADWWRERLACFGPSRHGHDKLLRAVFSKVFSWSIPTAEAMERIAGFVDGARLASYGAGSGYWEFLLREHCGLTVAASDILLEHRFVEMAQADFRTAPVDPEDVLLIAWVVNDESVVDALLQLLSRMVAGQRLVLVGDRPKPDGTPRTCGTKELFTFLSGQFAVVEEVPLVRFSHLEDAVLLYRKK